MSTSGKLVGFYGFKVCPFCGGGVEYAGITIGHIFPGAHTGQMYLCGRCGYQGSFIIEVDDLKEVNKIEEDCRQRKGDGTLKVPSFRFPGNWIWFWRGVLVLMVVSLILGLLVNLYRIVA